MHYTGTLYRNPNVPPSPLLEVTQGCTHNKCKFCTMYKGLQFKMSPKEWLEEDIREIAERYPETTMIQWVGANPFCLSFDRMKEVCDLIHKYLPNVNSMNMAARVTDIRNKTVDELKELRKMGIDLIYIGVESGDDWTLDRVNKGYHAEDILEQCHKLDQSGINYWMTFMGGIAGRSHSRQHAENSARIFNQCHPESVGTTGLVLFPGTPLLDEARSGYFDPLTEKEMLEELYIFLENLECDASLISHHTVSADLNGPDFLGRKEKLLKDLRHEIDHADMDRLSAIRSGKRYL